MSAFVQSLACCRRSAKRAGLAAGAFLCLWPAVACADDAPPAAAIVNPVARQSLEQFPATLARPLFAPSRRKAPPDPAPVARAEEPPSGPPATPKVTLLGIISDADGTQAVLRPDGIATDVRVHVGDDVGGWKVAGIGEKDLTLTLEERSVSIALFAPKPRPDPVGGARHRQK